MRTITARFDARCRECNRPINAGDRCLYDDQERKVYHEECSPEEPDDSPDARKLAEELGFE